VSSTHSAWCGAHLGKRDAVLHGPEAHVILLVLGEPLGTVEHGQQLSLEKGFLYVLGEGAEVFAAGALHHGDVVLAQRDKHPRKAPHNDNKYGIVKKQTGEALAEERGEHADKGQP